MMSRTMIAAALTLSIGCTASDPDAGTPRDTAAPAVDTLRHSGELPDTAVAPQRPETREDTVLLEGMAEVERATLVRSPAGFGIPFSTYVSNGLRTEFLTEGSGASVRFSAAFGGVENRNAYMQVYMYEEGVQQPTVNDVISGFVRSRAPGIDEAEAIEAPPWALEAMRFSYIATGGVRSVGRAMTGRHNGRYFHVIMHYPAEYAEGMGPRIGNILRHWRWEDTGERLER